MSAAELAADFLAACDRAREATTDGQRRVTRGAMIVKAEALRDRQYLLERDITAGWRHLDANPDDPYFDQNEGLLIGWIAERDAIEQALRDGLERWLGDTDAVVASIASLDAVSTVDGEHGAAISARMRVWNAQVFSNPNRKPPPQPTKSHALRTAEAEARGEEVA